MKRPYLTVVIFCTVMFSIMAIEQEKPYLYHPARNPESKTTVLAAHGIVDDYTQAYQYFKERIDSQAKRNPEDTHYLYSIYKSSLAAVCFDDGGSGIKKYYRASRSSLGQSHEIERMYEVHHAILADQDSIRIHGVSRGGAVAVNFMAKYNPDNVKGMVLESPFDSLEGMISEYTNNKRMRRYGYKLAGVLFGTFSPDGEHPIEQVPQIINKQLPILIVCTKQDRTVPWKSSVRLYKKFMECGFANAHLVVTERGPHAKILWGAEGDTYQNAVHAFNRRYGFDDYNESYADAGRVILSRSKPSLKEVEEMLK